MNLERFTSQRSKDWAALEALVRKAGPGGGGLSPSELRQLAALHRSAAADLALARRHFRLEVGTERLAALVGSSHAIVYGRAGRDVGFGEFVTRRFWQRVVSGGRMLGLSALCTVVPTVLGFVWAWADPEAAAGVLPAGFHATAHPGRNGIVGAPVPARVGIASMIFVHNIEVAILVLVGGFTLGLLSAYLLASNGLTLGVLFALEVKAGAWEQFVRLVVPHGVLEISCIVVAGSGGFQIARAIIDPGRRTRATSLAAVGPALTETIIGVAACLVVAGCVEGIVTTWDLPLGLALLVGLTLGLGFWALVTVRGRGGVPEGAPSWVVTAEPVASG